MSGISSINSQTNVIQYERDPQQFQDAQLDIFSGKITDFASPNLLKKSYQKKKKTLGKGIQSDKQRQIKNQAMRIAELIKKARINNVVQQFINKLKMTITFNRLTGGDQQAYFSIGQRCDQIQFKEKIKRGSMPKIYQNQRFEFISIIIKFLIFSCITYMNSLKIAFEGIGSLEQVLKIFIWLSVSYFTIEISSMIYRVKCIKVPFWNNFYYWLQEQEKFCEFLINFGLFLQAIRIPSINQIIMIFILKQVTIEFRKLKKIQINFVVSINFERYWELLKILLLNFCLAHILSIILNLMIKVTVEGQENWYANKNISTDSEWFTKYIWGCYWGTNIMLSVGFGDIYARNQNEALMLIFIQTFSCIILAYNISEVSKILQNMTLMDQEKKLKFKVLNQMGIKYNFQQTFKTYILNHIDKSIEKKHQLSYIQENLIEQLPEKLKFQVKIQMNKNVFREAAFFKNLTKKTQNLLAEKVNKIFAHPEQIVLKNMQTWKILILRQGNLALTYNKGSSRNNGYIIEQFFASQVTRPELISLKFMKKQKIKGDLKSLDFSILNALQIDQFQSFLKDYDNPMFEYYCSQRDRQQFNKYDLQVRNCKICVNCKHDKTECPRMHFIPLKEHVIYKNLFFYLKANLKRSKIVMQRKTSNIGIALKLYKDHITVSSMVSISTKKNIFNYTQKNQSSMNSMLIENIDITKKIDKCLQKLDQGLKIIKGQIDMVQLEFDTAYNYKKYFPKKNPNNLQYYFNNNPYKKKDKVDFKSDKKFLI